MANVRRSSLRASLTLTGAGFALAALAWLLPPAAALDTEPPVYLSSFPTEGSYINVSSLDPGGLARVEVQSVVRDFDSGVEPGNTTVSVWMEGASRNATPVASVAQYDARAFVATFDLFLLTDGRYLAIFEATDNALNTRRIEANFTVDTVRPALSVSAPQSTNQTSIPVRIDLRDEGSGLATLPALEYRSGCSFTKFPAVVSAVVLPGRIIAEASVPVCIGTSNEFTVTAEDAAGNTATFKQERIACDLTPPQFSAFTPKPFSRVDAGSVRITASINDDSSGIDLSTIAYRFSTDGGITWGDWLQSGPSSTAPRSLQAVRFVNVSDGASIAVQWRASDEAGNGPRLSPTQFFYVNGPPFIEEVSPGDGTVIYEYNQVYLRALADDPDTDNVTITVSSDRDGVLGRADGRAVHLSLGIHNLTFTLNDGHDHVVTYTTQVQVVVRPPPDPRPLFFTAIIAGAMLWFTYAVWAKPERGRPRDERSLAKTPDEAPPGAKA